MNDDIRTSLQMLDKKKVIMKQTISDNSKRVRDKLADVLVSMHGFRKFDLKNKKIPNINEEYIEKKVGGIKKTFSNVFDDYIRNMILQTTNVKYVFLDKFKKIINFHLEKNKKVKKSIGLQCTLNLNEYIRQTEQKLANSKKFYLSEIKAYKRKINNVENEKNISLDEKKKYVYKIKVFH